MIGRRAALILMGLWLCWATPVLADRLFAANGGGGSASTLFILNPNTGAVVDSVGPIGFAVTALAYEPITGILYGSTGSNSEPERSLIRIDTATGAGTLIGPFNTTTPMADLSFSPSGILYGWSGFTSPRGLYRVDVTTGAATQVGPNTGRPPYLDGNGLAFDRAGNLFGAATADVIDSAALFSVDPATGVSTFIANLTPLPGNPDASVSALAFDSLGRLFGSLQNFSSSANPFDSFLVTIDTATGTVHSHGQTIDRLDALAFLPGPRTAPAASTVGLAMLTALLAMTGMWLLAIRPRTNPEVGS